MAKSRRPAKPESCEITTDDSHQVVEQISVSPCSIELTRDAKGQPKWAIKIYGERAEMEKILDEVIAIDGQLRSRLS